MKKQMTENGSHSQTAPHREQLLWIAVDYVQYDYRHTDGELFTTAAPNLFTARERRDKWLKDRKPKKLVASKECQELMKQADERIKQLSSDIEILYPLAKSAAMILGMAQNFKSPALKHIDQSTLDMIEKFEEYENRSQRTSST